MPLTAGLGILTAYLLNRQRFAGRGAVRVPDHAELRHPRHGDRHQLHPGLQRAADRADRHRADHDHRVRVPEHAGRHPRRAGQSEPDRPQPRRGVAHAGRAAGGDAAPGDPADPAPGGRDRDGLCLRPRHHQRQRGDLPGQRRIQPRHGLHRRPRRVRRVWAGDRLFGRADRHHGGGAAGDPGAGRRAADRRARSRVRRQQRSDAGTTERRRRVPAASASAMAR